MYKIIVDTPTEYDLKNYYEYCKETLELHGQLEGGFILLAERLKNIRDRRLWEGSYEGFKEFLREMRISVPSASKLIGVYEKFVLMGGISRDKVAEVGWTNISIFLPLIRTKEDALRIWDETHLLDRTDALRSYAEMRTGKDMATCEHDWVTLRYCTKCQLREKVYAESEYGASHHEAEKTN